jgi:hypothetical protein
VILIIWLIATHRYRAAAWAFGTAAALTAAGIILAGPAATLEYIRVVVPSINPMGYSPAVILSAPWLTYVLLAIGVAAVVMRRSFRAAILTIVFGTPGIGVASLGMLGALLENRAPQASTSRGSPGGNWRHTCRLGHWQSARHKPLRRPLLP